MKNLYKSLVLISFFFYGLSAYAQTETMKTIITPQQYEEMKKAGTLTDTYIIRNTNETNTAPALQPKIQSNYTTDKREKTNDICNCFQTLDSSWAVVPFTIGTAPYYRNDDGSSPLITLPFSFCFYGSNYTQVYINNNGNISFNSTYSVFSPVGLQAAAEKMVAPFWADVDTRNTLSGIVHYKVTNTALIVRWDSVGYYSQHVDKVCSFQCIITNGADPLVPNGNNVKFCYGQMQWTTGDASLDSAGFCAINGSGYPAVVGASNADGVNYVQFGQFGRPGNAYSSSTDPYPYSGVGWLNYQTFIFSTCSANNIPPILAGLSYCDTVHMCAGDTLTLPVHFLSPEITQITHDTAWSTMTGFSILSQIADTTASITVQIIAYNFNYGVNTVTFQAIDNGNPNDTTTVTLFIDVDTFSLPLPVISTLHPYVCPNVTDTIWVNSPPTYNSYLWSNSNTTDTVFVIPGVYKVTVTSPNGCRAIAIDTVHSFPGSVPIITGVLQHCVGDSSLLTTTNYLSYLWSTGATTQAIYVDTGIFTVTVVDTNGCTGTSLPVHVIEGALQPGIGGVTHTCGTDSANLIAQNGFLHYHWSNGDSTINIHVHSGTFTVTVTDSAGCTGTASITVTSSPNPTPTITGANTYCGNGGTTLSTQNYTGYSWSGGGTTQSVSVSSGIYIVTVTDSLGCVGVSNPDTVISYPNPTPVITGQNHICGSGTVNLSTSSYTLYHWSTNGNTQTISGVGAGTYIVTVTDNHGCTGISPPFTVTLSNPSVTITGPIHNCGSSTSYIVANPTNFTSYLWSNSSTADSISVNSGTYIVQITDSTGCTATASVTVTSTPNPTPTITGASSYCGNVGTTLFANPTGLAGYLWSNASNADSVHVTAGTYLVTVTDGFGCTGTASQTVIEHPLPTPQIIGDSTFCKYDSVVLSVNNQYNSYLWSNGATTQSITTDSSEVFTVAVTDGNGCIGISQAFTTSINPTPFASFTITPLLTGRPDTIITFNNTSVVINGIIDSTIWYFGDGDSSTLYNPTHTYQNIGTYLVTLIIISADGCRDTISMDYIIDRIPVVAPNVFTPNGDGKNDLLVFQNLWEYPNSHLIIYNRWGIKLYENPDYKNDWTGDGHPDGTYYYILHIGDAAGTTLKGTIEIIKNH